MEKSDPPLAERYHLLTRLGEGGMATVWLAHDARLDVRRAIKILDPALRGNERIRARFEAEARAMARLQHPSIVLVHDVGDDGDRSYIVMELVHGGSLVEKVRTRGPMAARIACEVLAQVLDALDAAHAQGIVHRDVKPHNILLTADGIPKLGDFGIAQVRSGNASMTRTGSVMGTIPYMAPEQKSDTKGVGPAADVYGAGATLYHLVSGAEPYDLYVDQVRGQVLQNLYPAIAEIVDRATRYDPTERYRSAGEMRGALLGVIPRLPLPSVGLSGWMGLDPNTAIAAPSSGASTDDLSTRASATVDFASAIPAATRDAHAPDLQGAATLITGDRRVGVGPPASEAGASTVLRTPSEVAPRGGSGRTLAAVGIAGIGLLGLVALGGLVAWPWGPPVREGTPTPSPAPVTVRPVHPAPVQVSAPEPAPTTAPAPPTQRPPAPAPTTAHRPTPAEPAPVPAPSPAPAPEPTSAPEPAPEPSPAPPSAEGSPVRILSLPRSKGATLSVDGAVVGPTPWSGPLEPGRHRLVLTPDTGVPRTWTLEVKSGTPVTACWDFGANAVCPK